MSTQKQWNAKDLSIVYWLSLWGYQQTEIGEIAQLFIPARSVDGIRNQVSDCRKYISIQKGYNVANKYLSESFKTLIKKAIKIQPIYELKQWEDSKKEFKPSYLMRETINSIPKANPATQQQQNTSQDDSNSKILQVHIAPENMPKTQAELATEPNILDVMKMAKELGAQEVEYKGMKIKY